MPEVESLLARLRQAPPAPPTPVDQLRRRAEQRRKRRRAWLGTTVGAVAVAGVVGGLLGTAGPSRSTVTMAAPATTVVGAAHSPSMGSGLATPVSGLAPVEPGPLAVAPGGGLYVSDPQGYQILKMTSQGKFVRVAGTGEQGVSTDGGQAVDAQLDDPGALAVSPAGDLVFVDGQRVRMVEPDGTIQTIAGQPSCSGYWVSDGTPALDACMNPTDVTYGPDHDLYISTSAEVLRLSDGVLTEIAGGAAGQRDGKGVGGPATEASVDGAQSIAFDAAGDLYIFGFDFKTLLVVTQTGIMTQPGETYDMYPRDVGGFATAPDGSVLAIGTLSLDRLSPSGVTTIYKFPTKSTTFHGISNFSPNGIAVGSDGTVYVDTFDGNGYSDRNAIAQIDLQTETSSLLWDGDAAATTPATTAPPTTVPAPGSQPADPAAAKAGVVKAFQGFYGGPDILANVEGVNPALVHAVQEAKANNPNVTDVGVNVEQVVFTSPTTAWVQWQILVDGSPVTTMTGGAVLDKGTWKLTYDTACADFALGRAPC